MLEQLKRVFSRVKGQAKQPLELTVADQLALKFLFAVGGQYVPQNSIVEAVLIERPAFIPHEVLASILKLRLVGAVERNEQEQYRIAPKARKLKDILPDRPSVNMTYYG